MPLVCRPIRINTITTKLIEKPRKRERSTPLKLLRSGAPFSNITFSLYSPLKIEGLRPTSCTNMHGTLPQCSSLEKPVGRLKAGLLLLLSLHLIPKRHIRGCHQSGNVHNPARHRWRETKASREAFPIDAPLEIGPYATAPAAATAKNNRSRAHSSSRSVGQRRVCSLGRAQQTSGCFLR